MERLLLDELRYRCQYDNLFFRMFENWVKKVEERNGKPTLECITKILTELEINSVKGENLQKHSFVCNFFGKVLFLDFTHFSFRKPSPQISAPGQSNRAAQASRTSHFRTGST